MPIAPGGTGVVTITATRLGGFTGPILISLESGYLVGGVLKTGGITAPDITIPAGSTTADMTISVATTVGLGTATLSLLATPADNEDFDSDEQSFPINVTAPGTFTMALTGGAPDTYRGQTFHIGVTLTRNSLTLPVTLAVTPLTGFTFVITQPGTGDTGDIAVTVGASVALPSSNTIQIQATAPTAPTQSGAFSTTVWAPGFTLTPTPATISVAQGGNASISLAVARDPGNTSDIALAGSSLQAGITSAPATLTGAGPATVTASVALSVPV
ncbi:MAG: hypothetical protein ABUL71_01100, partial [Gemmatimonadota bacterium]